MFEFISENPDTLALSIAVIAGLFGFVKWLDARTLKLKNERYVKYIQLIRVLSGYNDCLGPLKLCHYLLTKGVKENGTETVFG